MVILCYFLNIVCSVYVLYMYIKSICILYMWICCNFCRYYVIKVRINVGWVFRGDWFFFLFLGCKGNVVYMFYEWFIWWWFIVFFYVYFMYMLMLFFLLFFYRLFCVGNFCLVCLKVYCNDEFDLFMVCCDMCDCWIYIGLIELFFYFYLILIWKIL